MTDFEQILIGLVVVTIIVTIARKIGIAYPILLVIGGLALGLVLSQVPGADVVVLDPDTVFVVFLPPLLFAAAWQTPIRDLRANTRPIALLSIGLVIFTTLVVGFVAVALIPGLPLAAALTLGAIVAPPDAVAATSILRRLAVPRRIQTILEGESLVNDATALTAYRGAVIAATTTGVIVLADLLAGFAWALVGGIVIGLGIAVIVSWMWRRLFDPPVEVTLSLLIPYAVYLPAEAVHSSGVIAAVTAGLYLGVKSSRILSSDTRILAGGVWQIVIFVLNGLAFLLIGLQLPAILRGLSGNTRTELLTDAVVICAAVILARFVWVYPATYLPRWLSKSIARRDPAPSARAVFVIGWAGMRGVVSLAAALALPIGFPERDLLLFLTFAVILATLVGQGLTLPFLLRALGLAAPDAADPEELEARAAANEAALQRLAQARDEWSDHLPLIENLEQQFQHRAEHLPADHDTSEGEDEEHIEHRAILASVIEAQREAIISARDQGVINDEVLRRIERELDLEELRLEAVL